MSLYVIWVINRVTRIPVSTSFPQTHEAPLSNLSPLEHIQVFGITKNHNPTLEGNVFPNPVDVEGFMVMLVYKNGSLTREGTLQYLIKLKVTISYYLLDKGVDPGYILSLIGNGSNESNRTKSVLGKPDPSCYSTHPCCHLQSKLKC